MNKLILLQIRAEDLRERERNPVREGQFQAHGHVFVEYGAGVAIPGVASVRKIYCQVNKDSCLKTLLLTCC